MSIRVLKAKAQSRRLVAEKNAVSRLPVNLNYSDNSPSICPGAIGTQKAPAPQKSYGNYNRQALLGYSGIANRVVSLRNSQTNAALATNPERNTYKRMPKFSQSQRMYNLSCKSVLCSDRRDRCPRPTDPSGAVCRNDDCGKSNISITKDIGYLSAGDYTQRKVGRRVRNTTDEYEIPLAQAGRGRLTC